MGIRINNWEKYKFEGLVENIREQVMPTPKDSENYIGLEHLDSGSLHVKRWGTPIQLKGTKFTMKKGDLLFARRNAYLRRVAIAPHDGLFSAHGMIFRPKEKVILPSFLPFFLSSDMFWDRAIKISVGSLSPTINWGTLRHEEFKLPSLNDQKRIADLLWSIDNAEEKYLSMGNLIDKTFWSFFESLMSGFSKVKFGEVLIPKKTQSIYPHKHDKYLGMEHIDSGAFLSSRFGNSDQAKANTFIFEEGDLLYGKLRPYLDKCVISTFSGVCSTEILVYDVKKEFSKDLVLFYMHSPKFVNYASNRGYGTKMPRVSHEIIAEYAISMPMGNEQGTILAKLKNLRKTSVDVRENIVNCKAIKKQIINQIFE